MWSFFSRDPAKGFPYEVGEKIIGLESDQSIWSLHEGKQKVQYRAHGQTEVRELNATLWAFVCGSFYSFFYLQ